MRENWKKLAAVGMIESSRRSKASVSVERRYFIVSSGVKTVEQFALAARAHWGVEAMHWVLDVTFREDDCRVRKATPHATCRYSQVRALCFAQRQALPDRSLRRRRKLADRRPDYRVELLGLKLRQ